MLGLLALANLQVVEQQRGASAATWPADEPKRAQVAAAANLLLSLIDCLEAACNLHLSTPVQVHTRRWAQFAPANFGRDSAQWSTDLVARLGLDAEHGQREQPPEEEEEKEEAEVEVGAQFGALGDEEWPSTEPMELLAPTGAIEPAGSLDGQSSPSQTGGVIKWLRGQLQATRMQLQVECRPLLGPPSGRPEAGPSGRRPSGGPIGRALAKFASLDAHLAESLFVAQDEQQQQQQQQKGLSEALEFVGQTLELLGQLAMESRESRAGRRTLEQDRRISWQNLHQFGADHEHSARACPSGRGRRPVGPIGESSALETVERHFAQLAQIVASAELLFGAKSLHRA